MTARRYPRKIAELSGNRGRRIVKVYEGPRGKYRVYLYVDGEMIASEAHDSKKRALGSAEAWT